MSVLRRALSRAVALALPKPAPRPAPRAAPAPPVSRPFTHARVDPVDDSLRAALSLVVDPEVGVDIVNLGLLRGWTVQDGRIHLRLTATSRGCPVAPQLAEQAQDALGAAFPDYACSTELVWDPPWTPDDMTPRARAWIARGGPPPSEETPVENTLDIRPIAPRDRHPLIFHTFDALARGAGFVLVNDHDPKPLYYQFQAEYGQVFGWEYMERGPVTWKVRISRT